MCDFKRHFFIVRWILLCALVRDISDIIFEGYLPVTNSGIENWLSPPWLVILQL